MLISDECGREPCDHVMRSRCTECKKEQYGPVVRAISHGILRCPRCGKFNRVEVKAAK